MTQATVDRVFVCDFSTGDAMHICSDSYKIKIPGELPTRGGKWGLNFFNLLINIVALSTDYVKVFQCDREGGTTK